MLKTSRWWPRILLPFDAAGGGGPGGHVGTAAAEGDELLHQLADGERLARHALRARLEVDARDIVLLNGARSRLEELQRNEEAQLAFVAALRRVAAMAVVAPEELRAFEQRERRLAPELQHARELLYFAASTGRTVDDEQVQPILAALHASDAGGISEAQEQAFLLAYRHLAADMAPVSGATLEASRQRIPRLLDAFARPRRFIEDLTRITLGRFVHFALFTIVLMAAGSVIAYQTVGEAAFSRYRALDTQRATLKSERPRALELQRTRQRELFSLIESKGSRRDDVAVADVNLQAAISELGRIDERIAEVQDELAEVRSMLEVWVDQPCTSPAMQWACSFALAHADRPRRNGEIVFDAEMGLKRLNVIMLPMLMGLLGAYAFVLRTVSREIRERSFAENSALHHVARLSLGALAGIAAGWFLRPEQVGLLNSVPAWGLAFVAGYGIELLFAFLDRIVVAFTSKQASAP